MDSKNLNLLVVEDDLSDEQLLCEALTEIEENRRWCTWSSASIVQVDQLADALDCLNRQRFDAVLLNLSLPDSPALWDSFIEVYDCAQGAPVLVLADEEDDNFAHRLIRQGAADVVLKPELEYQTLARSIQYAIERRRKVENRSAFPISVLSREALLSVAPHYTALAFAMKADLYLAVLEISGLAAMTSDDREKRELFLMRAAELLRDAIPSPGLVARIEKCRFALILAGMNSDAAEQVVSGSAHQIETLLGHLAEARLSFSVTELTDIDDLEMLLNRDPEQPESSWGAKLVMLSD